MLQHDEDCVFVLSQTGSNVLKVMQFVQEILVRNREKLLFPSETLADFARLGILAGPLLQFEKEGLSAFLASGNAILAKQINSCTSIFHHLSRCFESAYAPC